MKIDSIDLLENAKLNYPSAREWMWSYCIYLGPWTDPETGKNYDLGIFIDDTDNVLGAIVDGNRPGDYLSANLSRERNDLNTRPVYLETIRRARELNLINY